MQPNHKVKERLPQNILYRVILDGTLYSGHQTPVTAEEKANQLQKRFGNRVEVEVRNANGKGWRPAPWFQRRGA